MLHKDKYLLKFGHLFSRSSGRPGIGYSLYFILYSFQGLGRLFYVNKTCKNKHRILIFLFILLKTRVRYLSCSQKYRYLKT